LLVNSEYDGQNQFESLIQALIQINMMTLKGLYVLSNILDSILK